MTKAWTPEATQELRDLFAKGLTMFQIAAALSQTFGKMTRSAVISKCDREGLKRGQQKVHASFAATNDEDKTWPHPVTDTSVSFLDLTIRQCKWPVGHGVGAKMMCCGATKPLDKPYCGVHQKAAASPDQRPFSFKAKKR
jgi:hypothetical protein